MIYNDKLWQSINETNKESKYLQFCRSKAYCQFRIHCLLEAVCDLTFKLYKTPSGCCVSFASQVRATTEQRLRPKHRVFKQKLSWFVLLPDALWPKCCNVTNMTQCDQYDALWPIWHIVTNMTHCDQYGAMWPIWRNVTKTFQLNDSCAYTCLLVNYSITKAWIVVYISINYSINSLSSSVKITSQHFSCVCRILICGISHEFSAACSSTVREVPAVSTSQPLSILMTFALNALSAFVLLPVAWVLTSLARATFWVHFASVIFANLKLVAFCLCYVIQ